jgi:hypothetical protein
MNSQADTKNFPLPTNDDKNNENSETMIYKLLSKKHRIFTNYHWATLSRSSPRDLLRNITLRNNSERYRLFFSNFVEIINAYRKAQDPSYFNDIINFYLERKKCKQLRMDLYNEAKRSIIRLITDEKMTDDELMLFRDEGLSFIITYRYLKNFLYIMQDIGNEIKEPYCEIDDDEVVFKDGEEEKRYAEYTIKVGSLTPPLIMKLEADLEVVAKICGCSSNKVLDMISKNDKQAYFQISINKYNDHMFLCAKGGYNLDLYNRQIIPCYESNMRCDEIEGEYVFDKSLMR